MFDPNKVQIALPAMPLEDVNLLLEGLGELPTKRGYRLTEILRGAAMNTLNAAREQAIAAEEAARKAAEVRAAPPEVVNTAAE